MGCPVNLRSKTTMSRNSPLPAPRDSAPPSYTSKEGWSMVKSYFSGKYRHSEHQLESFDTFVFSKIPMTIRDAAPFIPAYPCTIGTEAIRLMPVQHAARLSMFTNELPPGFSLLPKVCSYPS